jgi:hypothetical protein
LLLTLYSYCILTAMLRAPCSVLAFTFDQSLRQLSIDYLTSLPFDGIAIGGSLGRDREDLVQSINRGPGTVY